VGPLTPVGRRRRPGLLLPALAAALAVAGWLAVVAVVRAAHERSFASRIDRGLREFDVALERSAEDVGAKLARLEQMLLRPESEGLVERLLAGGPSAVGEAEWLGGSMGLDVLTIFDERGTVVSSRHWPELAGLEERALDGLPLARSALRRIADPAGSRLAVVLRRAVAVGDRGFSVVGGRAVGRRFVQSVAGEGTLVLFDFEAAGDEPLAANADALGELAGWSDLAHRAAAVESSATLANRQTGESWSVGRRELRDDRGVLLGALLVATSHRDLDRLLGRLRVVFLAIGVAAVALAAAGAAALSSRWSRPADRLVRAVDAIAAGQADYTFPQGPGDELDHLAQAFSRLQRSLERQHRRSAAAERVAAWREAARRVAHEVKNPLAPIRLTVENLMRARRQDPRLFDELFEDGARTILEEVEQLRRLVTEFSEFARLPEPRPRPVDIHRLLDSALELHAAEPDLVVVRNYVGQLPLIEVDPDQIGRVLKNVIGNAIDAMAGAQRAESPHRLQVRTALGRETVEIEISDNGPGFPEAALGRIFEPYFTTKAEGTGLGLAIAYRIVAEHDGIMDAENRREGGATVVIRLPLRTAQTTAGEARA